MNLMFFPGIYWIFSIWSVMSILWSIFPFCHCSFFILFLLERRKFHVIFLFWVFDLWESIAYVTEIHLYIIIWTGMDQLCFSFWKTWLHVACVWSLILNAMNHLNIPLLPLNIIFTYFHLAIPLVPLNIIFTWKFPLPLPQAIYLSSIWCAEL